MEVIEFFLNPGNAWEFEVVNIQYGTTKTTLPFFERGIDYRPTLIRLIEITSQNPPQFNPQLFNSQESDWLVQVGFLNQQKTQFSSISNILTKLGQKLYQSLFPKGGKSEEILKAALQRARGNELHIQFSFEAESVGINRAADYPWELLHDGTRFLAWHKVSFSRYIAYNDSPPNLPLVNKLNVLLVCSEAFDSGQGMKQLEQGEFQAIKAGLELACQQGHIHLTDLAEAIGGIPTFKALQKYLTEHRGEHQPHILHFDGHGLYGKKCYKCGKIHAGIKSQKCGNEFCKEELPPAQGYLVFADENGQPDYVSAAKLGATLHNLTPGDQNTKYGSLAVVVLSACQSGMAVAGDSIFNGTAQQLIHHNIPAVVAMQYSVSVKAAKNFAEQFYRALGQRDSLCAAVRQARIAMDIEGNQWYRPVLYLRWYDNEGGELFGLQQNISNISKPRKQPQNKNTVNMPLNLQIILTNGLLNELAKCCANEGDAYLLLVMINFPNDIRPKFDKFDNSRSFWVNICEKIQQGQVKISFEELFSGAASMFPGNPVFASFAK